MALNSRDTDLQFVTPKPDTTVRPTGGCHADPHSLPAAQGSAAGADAAGALAGGLLHLAPDARRSPAILLRRCRAIHEQRRAGRRPPAPGPGRPHLGTVPTLGRQRAGRRLRHVAQIQAPGGGRGPAPAGQHPVAGRAGLRAGLRAGHRPGPALRPLRAQRPGPPHLPGGHHGLLCPGLLAGRAAGAGLQRQSGMAAQQRRLQLRQGRRHRRPRPSSGAAAGRHGGQPPVVLRLHDPQQAAGRSTARLCAAGPLQGPGPHPRTLEPLPAQRHAHGGGHHGHLHPACAQRHLCGRSRVQLSRHRPAGHLQRQVSRLQPAHAHVLFTGAMVISSSLLAQSINEAIDPRIKSGEVVC